VPCTLDGAAAVALLKPVIAGVAVRLDFEALFTQCQGDDALAGAADAPRIRPRPR
jgi:hypothetical protein